MFLALLLTASLVGKGMSEEDKKKAFLQTRATYTAVDDKKPPQSGSSPAKTAAPAPAAKSTPSPKSSPRSSAPKKSVPKTATKQRTQSGKNQPKPTPKATPKPTATAAATPEPTPPPPPQPSPTSTPAQRVKTDRRGRAVPIPKQAIVVEKSGHSSGEEEPPPPPPKRGFLFFGGSKKYKYLTPQVCAAIDRAKVRKHRWRFVVIHNSGTRQGNAKAFDYYHTRVRKMPNGLAYHFVIGNGTSSGDGQIEIGNRWTQQINGGHVHSDYLNDIALGICLVGDYNRDNPTKQQLEALDELTTYLRRRVGKTDRKFATVKAHKDINPRPTDCPGTKFPYRWLYSRFQ